MNQFKKLNVIELTIDKCHKLNNKHISIIQLSLYCMLSEGCFVSNGFNFIMNLIDKTHMALDKHRNLVKKH